VSSYNDILDEVANFILLKIRRNAEQEDLCHALEQKIREKINSMILSQLLNFLSSIQFKSNVISIDLLKLFKKTDSSGGDLPILEGRRIEGDVNVHKHFLDSLNPAAIQFLLGNEELCRSLSVDPEALKEYKRIKFLEEQDIE